MDKIELKDEERTPCEVWSRVMGYFRPVYIGVKKLWNIGKVQEFKDRKFFKDKEDKE
jgi:anaerobic ribonucleoside-triphosphate reductase